MSNSESRVLVVFVTAPDTEVGTSIARALVEERLAACVNLIPQVRSIYRWHQRVEEETEVLLVIKTRADRLAALVGRVEGLHPYELPEVLALPVQGGSEPYLAWLMRESTS